MPDFRRHWTAFFPPKPTFTEKNLPDLEGKVYFITGANTGIGKELASMLYSKNAKVWIAARSQERGEKAIAELRERHPSSRGSLVFLRLDLADLSTIKASLQPFLTAESKLHVLFNNAGYMGPASAMPRTPQGHELHIGTNNLGPHLLTKLLTPLLTRTAALSPKASVRIIWVSSAALDTFAAPGVGLPLDNLDFHDPKSGSMRYWLSKVGSWAQGAECARRMSGAGVLSVPMNPGNLRSELFRSQGWLIGGFSWMVGYPPVYGASTLLFAGLGEGVESGNWVIPFGRVYPLRPDLEKAMKTKAEGGTGGTHDFWEWCEEQVRPFA